MKRPIKCLTHGWYKPTLKYIILKFQNTGDRKKSILQTSKGTKEIIYKMSGIRMALHFSKGTLKTKEQWSKAFKIPKEKNFQPNNLYPSKLPFKCRGTISEKNYFHGFIGHLCFLFCKVSMQILVHFSIFFLRGFLCILVTKSFVIYKAWG